MVILYAPAASHYLWITYWLYNNVEYPEDIVIPVQSQIIIDGQALVHVMGKPKYTSTFGDLGKSFVNLVRRIAYKFSRAAVVFHRYRQHNSEELYTTEKISYVYPNHESDR